MNIFTVTCHNVYNYGASLQAYALQYYLKLQGYEIKIIDYRPDYLDWHYKLSWWVPSNSKYNRYIKSNPIFRAVYVILRFFSELMYISRYFAFKRFNEKHLILTKKCKNINEINSLCKNINILITGSDQVWNSCTLDNGLDPVFYLNFGEKKSKRISYAASFGSDRINEERASDIRRMLLIIDDISVRESTGINVLHELGLKGKVVCDPVFLLNKNEWSNLYTNTKLEDKYMLIYNLGPENHKLITAAKRIKEETGYSIISVRGNSSISCDREIRNAGPADFISLLSNAEFILTNSFHATAFSIIFNKKFYCFTNEKGKTRTRIIDILSRFSLNDRLNPQEPAYERLIDYNKINKDLDTYITQSKNWLHDSLKLK